MGMLQQPGCPGPSAHPSMNKAYMGLLVSEGAPSSFHKTENESDPWFG